MILKGVNIAERTVIGTELVVVHDGIWGGNSACFTREHGI